MGRALQLVPDTPPGSPTRRALRITAHPADDQTGGHLNRMLEPGEDRIFARFYVRFPDGAGYVHHFVKLGGYNPPTPWAQGGAGQRPRGDDRFTTGIEPYGESGRIPPPGHWVFYTYWPEMKRSGDGNHWGNTLRPARTRPVPTGRWQCVEVMIRLNTPGRRDGEMALWLDGELAAHFRPGAPRTPWHSAGQDPDAADAEPFEGLLWRTADDLRINFFRLEHYVTAGALRRQGVRDPDAIAAPNSVTFDHIVVARRYIGPLEPAEHE